MRKIIGIVVLTYKLIAQKVLGFLYQVNSAQSYGIPLSRIYNQQYYYRDLYNLLKYSL